MICSFQIRKKGLVFMRINTTPSFLSPRSIELSVLDKLLLIVLQGAPKVPKPRRGQPSITLPPSPVPTDRWQWGGCSDNVRFGLKKSREFMDSRYRKKSDIKTLIKLHNHNAGRLVSKNFISGF